MAAGVKHPQDRTRSCASSSAAVQAPSSDAGLPACTRRGVRLHLRRGVAPGRPAQDARQRVIDAFGKPAPRLYAAGEMGSAFGHLYLSGGNPAACFVGGRIAGRAAADETATDGAT